MKDTTYAFVFIDKAYQLLYNLYHFSLHVPVVYNYCVIVFTGSADLLPYVNTI